MATGSASHNFSITDGRAVFGDLNIYKGASAFSTVCWCKRHSLRNTSIIRHDGIYTAFQTGNSGYTIRSVYWNSIGEPVLHEPTTTLPDAWVAFAATWDKTSNSGKTTHILSGTSYTDNDVYTSNIRDAHANYLVFAGTEGNSEEFGGELCYVAMYNRKLSVAEVFEISKNPFSIVSGLKGSWPLTDGSTTCYDKSTNLNNGTYENATVSGLGPPVFLWAGGGGC